MLLLCSACVDENVNPDDINLGDDGTTVVDPSTSETPGTNKDVESYTRYQRYYYLPYASDFSGKTNGGSFSKNGITWTYTSCNPNNDASDYQRGLQINSSGNTKGWIFSTNFGENVCLEDVQVGIATNGSFGAQITFGNYTIGNVSTTTQAVTEFDLSGNYYIGDSLTFTCTDGGSKSCYLKYIAFTIYTLPSSTLELTTDIDEGDYSTEI